MVTKIKDGIYWIGSVDWEVREFHGYETSKGSSYNSYLIIDEKNVLIDSAKHYMFEELLEGISSIIDPKNIDYIVVNHAEKDHSGCIGKIVRISNAKIITNEKGKEHLELQYNTKDWEFIVVDTGDEISIGKKTLRFIRTPMLHWPDNMITYCVEDKVLFSNDAFGQHIATSERFDYEIEDLNELFNDAKEYFANILLPYKMLIPGAVEAVKGLDIEYICPSHGVIWKDYIDGIVDKYLEWSSEKCKNKAVIAYATMYNSTKKIAHAIGNGLLEEGVEVKIFNIANTPMNIIMREILDAKYVLIGSPTLNSNIYPPVAMFLAYMEGLKPDSNKLAVAFGSYGWMEIATDIIKKSFEKLNFEIIDEECLKCKFVPDEEYLQKCIEFGKKLSKL
jgi:flavorubredoxin